MVQGFEPTGVAARNLQECLLLQLRADPVPDPVAAEIVERHCEALPMGGVLGEGVPFSRN